METYWMRMSIGAGWIVIASSLIAACTQISRHAMVGEDVLLPCSCPSNKNYVVWQIGEHTIVDHYIEDKKSDSKSHAAAQFQGRTRLLFPENPGNCSLLLFRVSVADENIYSCFHNSEGLAKSEVSLSVTANYSPAVQCSALGPGLGGYHCAAAGGYPEGRIHWQLDGQPAPEDLQRKKASQDRVTGLYNLSSTLNLSVSVGSLLCVVENPALQINITQTCPHADASPSNPINETRVGTDLRASVAVSSVLLVLAVIFALVLIKFWRPCPSSKVPVPRDNEQTAWLQA
ncbi:hypothetical protein MATL_G00177610 [Megalops atlanticus]|uniref:Ig-like domain-containing protein n=1 Tax=Megalops atlanticus TaxID=7932 RepID=A0A9D3PLM6_MEGAT|nr:hypothetical protein MATL_G00177610 [Megalops atlanticus]